VEVQVAHVRTYSGQLAAPPSLPMHGGSGLGYNNVQDEAHVGASKRTVESSEGNNLSFVSRPDSCISSRSSFR
jgi:hypothetical protein